MQASSVMKTDIDFNGSAITGAGLQLHDGPFVIDHLGGHIIVRGGDQQLLLDRVRAMIADGLVLVSGPLILEREWVCVLEAPAAAAR